MSTETSKYTLVCFACRQTAKAIWVNTGKNRRCPQCGGVFENVGKHFNIPKKANDRAWKKSEAYFREINRSFDSVHAELMDRVVKRYAARRHQPPN